MSNMNSDEMTQKLAQFLNDAKVSKRALSALMANTFSKIYFVIDREWEQGEKLYKNIIISSIRYLEECGSGNINNAMESLIAINSLPLVCQKAAGAGADVTAAIAANIKQTYDVLETNQIQISTTRKEVATIFAFFSTLVIVSEQKSLCSREESIIFSQKTTGNLKYIGDKFRSGEWDENTQVYQSNLV